MRRTVAQVMHELVALVDVGQRGGRDVLQGQLAQDDVALFIQRGPVDGFVGVQLCVAWRWLGAAPPGTSYAVVGRRRRR